MSTADRQRRVLIVEDEPVQLFVLEQALRDLADRVQVETASNAEKALPKVEERDFDLIVTDLGMSGMGGVALTETVRSWGLGVTIVWVTAHDCRRFEEEAERLQVWRCLDKPFKVGPFREMVREALEIRQAASSSVA